MGNRKILCFVRFILLTFVFLLLIKEINAFGIGIPYSVQDPLRVYPGESKEVLIILQNLASEENITVSYEVSEGTEIVKGSDVNKYEIISGQSVGAEFYLKIQVPENAEIGREYPIRLMFKDITKREGRMVGLSSAITASFNVLVVERPEEIRETRPSQWIAVLWLIIIISIIIVLIVIILAGYFIFRRGSKKG